MIAGFDIYADIYTYCHVMSRHYFPHMNNGIGGTLNDNIPYIDIFELPSSLLRLVCEYATVGDITENTEYILSMKCICSQQGHSMPCSKLLKSHLHM